MGASDASPGAPRDGRDDDGPVDFGLGAPKRHADEPAGNTGAPAADGPEVIELADEPPPPPVGVRECPQCGVLLRRDSEQCDRCGAMLADAAAARSRPEQAERERVCRNCGYDLRGLSNRRCPECGAVDPIGAKRDRIVDAEQEYHRHLRRAQIIGGVLALLLIVVFGLIGGRLAAYWLVFAGIELACAIGVAAVLSYVAIDLDDPWNLTISRLFAAQNIGTAAAVAGAVLCAPGVILGAGAYVIAIVMLFELDPIEGFYLGFAALAVRIGLLVAIFAIL